MQRLFDLINRAVQLMLLFYLFARSGGSVDKLNWQNFKAEVYDTLKLMNCFNDLR